MYEVECAYRRKGSGLRFFRQEFFNERYDDLCELRVRFRIDEIYPAERDTGAAMDWNGDIGSIEMKGVWGRWSRLNGANFEAAKFFLLREFGNELWQAADEYADEVHYGEEDAA